MKKSTNLLAVLSASAAFAFCAPALFTADQAFSILAADAGWVEEHSSFRYLDTDGYYLTDTWKKRDGVMYYLDEDGNTALETMIDDEYYVDETGKMVTNQWISFLNEEDMDSPDSTEYLWYYFGKDGRAIKSKWYKIQESWYYFNSDGHMTTGKQTIDGFTYYLGEENDGVMKTGWISLEEESDDPENSIFWYYFDKNGRMIENQVDRKIDGSYYTFAEGRMQTGWVAVPEEKDSNQISENTSDAEATASASNAPALDAANAGSNAANAADSISQTPDRVQNYQYYEADGKRANGWYEMEGVPGISKESELHRFCFKNGKPYASQAGIVVFTIDSKKFGFNERGEMQTGKQTIFTEEGETANALFGADGVMKTGKQTIFDEDLGENQTWFFYTDGSKKGQGFHGIRDNSIYLNGLRQDSDSDLRFAPIQFEEKTYLVNTSGTIQKASASSRSTAKADLGNGFKDVKDANGKIWTVDVNGCVQ